ncbi:MAG TPA: SurA N-terminal domain-containing protein [Nitrospirota bacterium]|nr:SurA N-terminal domain-containing protein [Nitrospirota bacterium]
MKMYKMIVIVVMFTLAVSMTGCNKGANSTVLAKVNRGTITEADFKKQLEDLTPQMQQAVATDAKARREFLDDLVGIELVIQEAKRQGLDKDAEFKKRQDMMRKELEHRVQEDAKNELFNAVLKKEIGDKISKVPEPTVQEIRDYYDKNKDKIRNSAGKQLSLKEVEPQLKTRMMQERRRDLYLEYAKSLRDKAKIEVNEKALDDAMASIGQPKEKDLSNMKAQPAPKNEAAK